MLARLATCRYHKVMSGNNIRYTVMMLVCSAYLLRMALCMKFLQDHGNDPWNAGSDHTVAMELRDAIEEQKEQLESQPEPEGMSDEASVDWHCRPVVVRLSARTRAVARRFKAQLQLDAAGGATQRVPPPQHAVPGDAAQLAPSQLPALQAL